MRKTIVWFRQDLRLADNPALHAASRRGAVVPVYILDEDPAGHGVRAPGGASRWWLHHSLTRLGEALGGLALLRGDPETLLAGLAEQTGADAVHWNRCYEPGAIARDTAIKTALGDAGLEIKSFNGALLHEPWEVKTQGGAPYKVFTPYWRAARELEVADPLPAPKPRIALPDGIGEALEAWALLPVSPNWAEGWEAHWTPGETGAHGRLKAFLDSGLKGYGTKRDRPDLPHVSRLSPHLHHGEISPRQIWWATHRRTDRDESLTKDAEKFLSEVGWREFSYNLLFHFPDLPEKNLRDQFDGYPWRTSEADLKAWRTGMTGYPMVDAGMRELWATGYMHNRVRMIAASFLIKHLRLHWREGEAWFWDTLVDADLANNSASWQWVAGSGADAAPYFRIFNPMTQGTKFDPDGDYVRRWCPELAGLPDAHIHAPFEAPADMLSRAGVRLGETYPAPIVDHKQAREAALAGYETIKG